MLRRLRCDGEHVRRALTHGAASSPLKGGGKSIRIVPALGCAPKRRLATIVPPAPARTQPAFSRTLPAAAPPSPARFEADLPTAFRKLWRIFLCATSPARALAHAFSIGKCCTGREFTALLRARPDPAKWLDRDRGGFLAPNRESPIVAPTGLAPLVSGPVAVRGETHAALREGAAGPVEYGVRHQQVNRRE